MKVFWKVALFLIIFLLSTLIAPSSIKGEVSVFKDLNWDYWAFKEIKFLADEGMVSGYPDGTFRPENSITRAEFAKLVLLYSQPKGEKLPDVQTFPDVPKTHWAFPYIEACVRLGILSGYPDGTFKPEKSITKAEIVKLIVASKKYPEQIFKRDAFLDCGEGDWFFWHIQTALSYGILRVSDPGLTEEVSQEVGSYSKKILGYNFFPNSPATRAQACVLLYRLIFSP